VILRSMRGGVKGDTLHATGKTRWASLRYSTGLYAPAAEVTAEDMAEHHIPAHRASYVAPNRVIRRV
jgi:hypothetical protein